MQVHMRLGGVVRVTVQRYVTYLTEKDIGGCTDEHITFCSVITVIATGRDSLGRRDSGGIRTGIFPRRLDRQPLRNVRHYFRFGYRHHADTCSYFHLNTDTLLYLERIVSGYILGFHMSS